MTSPSHASGHERKRNLDIACEQQPQQSVVSTVCPRCTNAVSPMAVHSSLQCGGHCSTESYLIDCGHVTCVRLAAPNQNGERRREAEARKLRSSRRAGSLWANYLARSCTLIACLLSRWNCGPADLLKHCLLKIYACN